MSHINSTKQILADGKTRGGELIELIGWKRTESDGSVWLVSIIDIDDVTVWKGMSPIGFDRHRSLAHMTYSLLMNR